MIALVCFVLWEKGEGGSGGYNLFQFAKYFPQGCVIFQFFVSEQFGY